MELLALLLEFFAEFVVEFLAEALLDGGSRVAGKERAPLHPYLSFLLYAVMGLVLGMISLQLFPQHFIRNPEYRIWNLIFAPIVLGLMMGEWGKFLRRSGKRVTGVDSYANGFVFALVFALVRYQWAA